MEQSRTAWAAGILALYHEIDTAKVLVHKNKCSVLKFLVDCTAQYVQLWWIGRFEQEINTKSAEAVGTELLGVLKKGRRLLQNCGEKDAKSNFIILNCGGEFFEIVDDVERYSRMMNGLIAHFLEIWAVNSVDYLAKEKLIKQLQHKVQLDCGMLQDALTSAHRQDSSSRAFPFSIPSSDLKPGMCLGTGNFGIVSKGFWCGIIPVAIKQFSYDDTFEYEYTILRKLLAANCSHIVQVLGDSEFETDGHGSRKILVMELMDMDLRKLIEDKKKKKPTAARPFSVDESTDLMLQIAKGLRDLHRVEVVHRDIKPANILVKTADKGLTIKIADFGESKADFQTKDNIHTKRGTTLYMAPEMAVADEGGNYSKKVDVYSYGVVCMEILTGRPPNSAMQEGFKKGQMPSFLKSIPIPLYRIITDCLQLDNDKRPSFEEICDQLWAFKESILIIQDEIDDRVPSYVDERVLSNFRMYTKTLGEKGISMMPRISTSTRRRAIYCIGIDLFRKGVPHLPIDNLVDIELRAGLGIESSGRIKLLQPWNSVRNPFIGTGVEPQNHLSGNLQQDLGLFGQFKKLIVDQGKKLNLTFCIGGWHNSYNFSDAFSTDENRNRFINSVLELCRAYPIFNGLIIEWTILSDDGVNYGKPGNIVRREDGQNFILVLERLRIALPPGFIIGLFASRIPEKIKWPIERTSHLIDQIQLHFDDSGEGKAYHRSNLYSSSKQNFSFDEAVKYYISRGVDSSKLFIGISDYVAGSSNAEEIYRPAKRGLPDDLWGLCPSELVGHGFVERWDDEAKVPYAYHPERRLICVYDNAQSIKEKTEYIKANNLGGIYINHCPGAKACSKVNLVTHKGGFPWAWT